MVIPLARFALMMVCYNKLVLAPHFHVNGWATAELAKCKIPLTNQHLDKILGERHVPVLVGPRKNEAKGSTR